jgi:hypothetical protein
MASDNFLLTNRAYALNATVTRPSGIVKRKTPGVGAASLQLEGEDQQVQCR